MRQLKLLILLMVLVTGTAFAEHRSVSPIFDLNADASLGDLHPDSDSSVLSRRALGVRYEFETTGLDAATPHTMWIVAFNHPEFCASTPCSFADFPFVPGHDPRAEVTFVNAGGGVSGFDGSGTFGGFVHRAHRGVSGAEVVLGPGLVNPRGADIRLVIRSHGQPMGFEELLAALKTYRGGCNADNSVQPVPCRDYQISIHLPPGD